MVPRDPEVGRKERFIFVLLQPLSARLEHDVVFIAEVVGLLEAVFLHSLDRLEIVVAEVLDQIPAVLEVLGRRGEPDGVIPLLLQEFGQAPGRDAAGLGLGDLAHEVRIYAAVYRGNGLGGVGDYRVGTLGQETLLGERVEVRCRVQVLVVGRRGARPGRLEVDKDDVFLLGLGGLLQAGIYGRLYRRSVRDKVSDLRVLHL